MLCPNCGNDIQVKKGGGSYKFLCLILGLLFVLALVAGGVLGWKYFDTNDSYNNLKSRIEGYEERINDEKAETRKVQKELDEMSETVGTITRERDEAASKASALSQEMAGIESKLNEAENSRTEAENNLAEANNAITSLNQEITSLKQDLQAAKEENNNNNNKESEDLENLISAIEGINPATENFYSDRYVVILRKGKSADVKVTGHLTTSGSYTYTYKNSNDKVCSNSWGSWEENGISIPLTVKGTGAGTSVITITNSVNKDSFQILVYVTE